MKGSLPRVSLAVAVVVKQRVATFLACLALVLGLGWTRVATAAVFTEDFSADPLARGWEVFGDVSLFVWNIDAQNLEVTWDSSHPNSYFHHPLPAELARNDDFSIAFDLTLADVEVGVTPGRPFTFEIAIGLLNLKDATDDEFQRGSAKQSPNLVEFDYFPDSGFGATISPVIVSTNNQFIPSFNFPLELDSGARFAVTMRFTAADQTLRTFMTRDGISSGPIKDVKLPSSFTDFRVDAVSISSFSDAGGDGSIRAHGTVDNIRVEVPEPPVGRLEGIFENGLWQVTLASRTNWVYVLEAADDLPLWRQASVPSIGTGDALKLTEAPDPGTDSRMGDAAKPANTGRRFYRVRAQRP